MQIKTLKQAQRLINELCEKYSVPKIKVRKTVMPAGVAAVFLPEEYAIEFECEVDEQVLRHEFAHYLIRLSQASDEAEERACDAFARGY